MTHTIVISDLHGMSNLLDKAMNLIDETTSIEVSKIVFTGDYIDRGHDSAGVVTRVRTLVEDGRAIALKGNHEEFMYTAFDSNGEYNPTLSPWWRPNGGDEAIKSYYATYDEGAIDRMANDAAWMKNLPIYHLDDFRIYVHGFAPICSSPDMFTNEKVLWGRYDRGEDLGWNYRHVVHGHTPRKKPELLVNRTNLDTGAVSGGPLSVGVFDDSIPGGPVDIWEIT
jgi:serine/threonine protein phosphatase 1